jgi:hypothetical protein
MPASNWTTLEMRENSLAHCSFWLGNSHFFHAKCNAANAVQRLEKCWEVDHGNMEEKNWRKWSMDGD